MRSKRCCGNRESSGSESNGFKDAKRKEEISFLSFNLNTESLREFELNLDM